MTKFGHCYFIYICHLVEFNSHLTGDPRSTEIGNDNSPSYRQRQMLLFFYKMGVHWYFRSAVKMADNTDNLFKYTVKL